MPATTTTAIPKAAVCQDSDSLRNAGADRQARFRASAKGKAAYAARLEAKRKDTQRRRNLRWKGINKYRSLDSFGFFSGHDAAGVPRAADMKKENV